MYQTTILHITPVLVANRARYYTDAVPITSRFKNLETILLQFFSQQLILRRKYSRVYLSRSNEEKVNAVVLKVQRILWREGQRSPAWRKGILLNFQPKADSQGAKSGPIRTIRTIRPNKDYKERRLNTNKTQILHPIRLKQFVPNMLLGAKCRNENIQPD